MKKIIKPWGFEQIIEINKKYLLKKLFMKKNHRCSLQYHNKKKETIYVLSGELKIYIGKNKNKLRSKIYKKGSTVTIGPRIIHRMKAEKNCFYLEASTPHNSDVVRLCDDYKRIR
jgi:mannose-6-phosphate isomerase-like protein (cupin superfamily)